MNREEAGEKLGQFLADIKAKKNVLILTHNNPDPDCLASAYGLSHIFQHITQIKPTIAYGGIVGRAENKSMISKLKIEALPTSEVDLARYKFVALIDAQPGNKNVDLPNSISPSMIIDHHPVNGKPPDGGFVDVRENYGSTSTIISEYIQDLKVPMNKLLATALYYGIKTDTIELERDSAKADFEAFRFLFPHVSFWRLIRVQNPKFPREYFVNFSSSIDNALIYQDTVVSNLGILDTPDIVAEMADFLLRLEGMKWSLCIGFFEDVLFFSIRTTHRRVTIGEIATKIATKAGSGGGHSRSAAGNINISHLDNVGREKLALSVIERFLKQIDRVGVIAMKLRI